MTFLNATTTRETTGPLFTRRHYEWLAELLHHELILGNTSQKFIEIFSEVLLRDNSAFNIDRFINRALTGRKTP